MVDTTTIAVIKIPGTTAADNAKVIAVYPQGDTVPENLLKIYIEFSKPMKQGEALQNISFIRNGTDTLKDTFLDLQPELWNQDATVLTLWLDPGRIKRGLQPNLALGMPLHKGNKYTLIVNQDWKTEDGAALQRKFIKDFFAADFDSTILDPARWSVRIPASGSDDNIEVDFKEPLDYLVAKDAINITHETGMDVPGIISVYPGEKGFSFSPSVPWKKGGYYLTVHPIMEDLAGNNIEHLFDNDITQHDDHHDEQVKYYKRLIEIQ